MASKAAGSARKGGEAGDALRRRTIRSGAEKTQTEKDVETTEMVEGAEEEEDSMVLKGSRPDGPSAERREEDEKDYWGLDDDGDWVGENDQSKLKSRTRKTELQQIRCRPKRTTASLFVEFLVHLACMCFYMYVHVYDATVYKRNKGKGFEGCDTFGGRWKFLTYINLWVQSTYFFLAFLSDIMPQSAIKDTFHKIRDTLFTTTAFPLGVFVVVSFWTIYAVDRELVYPSRLDKYIPSLLNHHWHTSIAVCDLLEVLLVFHRFPSTFVAVVINFLVSTVYMFWVLAIFSVAGFWVYPFLKVMPPPVIAVFFTFCFFFVLILYAVGKKISYWRWREYHHFIDEREF